ncbi:MAG: transketolase [Gemmataceae bacterium]|nr:transketolase [Gemmataceae bacterium]
MDWTELERIAAQVRGKLVELSRQAEAPHLGSSLSCVDILVAAYWKCLRVDSKRPDDPGRDRFILSKGHAATTLYTVLAMRGFFPEKLLDSFGQPAGPLAEQPAPRCVPGVEAATGSLGHGLGMGLGMALAAGIQKRNYRVFVVMSDGECNEGSVWEAALLAPAKGVDNLIVIIDYNKWQATDRSNEVTALAPLKEKWAAFGWSAHEVDGHDLRALVDVMSKVPDGTGKPIAVVAHTVKGKGVSFMQDDNNWHYRIPKADEVAAARRELGLA